MPPKVRQRGKKPSKIRKLQQEQEEQQKEEQPVASSSSQIQQQADFIPLDEGIAEPAQQDEEENGQPNWIKLGERSSKAEYEAPFGYVDAELKAYLRAGWERVVELETQGYTAKSTLTALATAAGAHAQGYRADEGEEEDDELALLLQATLKEMDGKELLLSTDPDTSLIVEAILHRLPAKPLRVFVDRLAGNFATLAKHRFASHVVQACLATLQPAVTLEHATAQHFQQYAHSFNGKAASSAAYASDTATIVNEDGILRSATQLILDIAEELASDSNLLTALVTDSFGSHVLRSLLCVLTGRSIQSDSAALKGEGDLRSKRSAKFRTKKAPASHAAPAISASADLLVVIPDLLFHRGSSLRAEILADSSIDTIRRWATDSVASPLLQLLIEAEADSFDTNSDPSLWKGSLIDNLLNGFVSSPPAEDSEKDVYLETSLRDSVASHALQLALDRAPSPAAARFFAIYICNRMAKLCVHPAANHIVATLIRRLETSDLQGAVKELAKVATGMVKEQMIGCMQAAVDRVIELAGSAEAGEEEKELVKSVSDVVLAGFRLKKDEPDSMKLLIPAVLALKTRKAYLHTYAAHLNSAVGEEGGAESKGKKRGRDGKSKNDKKSKYAKKTTEDAGSEKEDEQPYTMDAAYELPASEATIQGSLLLQSLLRLPGPPPPPRVAPKRTFGRPVPTSTPGAPAPESWGSALVLDSLTSLPTLSPFARNPVSVHILISALSPAPGSSTTVFDWTQANRRRKLSSSLTTNLASFCGDKYGSRLADALWFSVDGFTKEKIVKTVIEHNNEILKGPYAGYFTNKLQLQLYRKGKVREWNAAVQAQKAPERSTEDAAARKERGHRPVVVETRRVNEKNGKKARKSKVDGELDSILDQI